MFVFEMKWLFNGVCIYIERRGSERSHVLLNELNGITYAGTICLRGFSFLKRINL